MKLERVTRTSPDDAAAMPGEVVESMALIMREHENMVGCRSVEHLQTPWAELPEEEKRRHRSWARRALALLGPIDPVTFKITVENLVEVARVEDRSASATLDRIHKHLRAALGLDDHKRNKAGRRQKAIRGNARREIVLAAKVIRARLHETSL